MIDARDEKAAPNTAAMAKKRGADFFELHRPLSRRWVRRD
jgi:hypothetical protein